MSSLDMLATCPLLASITTYIPDGRVEGVHALHVCSPVHQYLVAVLVNQLHGHSPRHLAVRKQDSAHDIIVRKLLALDAQTGRVGYTR
jgi:hypothetical protein